MIKNTPQLKLVVSGAIVAAKLVIISRYLSPSPHKNLL